MKVRLFVPVWMFFLPLVLGGGAFVFSEIAQGASPQLVDQKPLENERDEARARALMEGIRCLVCQNQSIEDSNADLALTLRQIIREQVTAGKTNDEIKTYLVARYGEWVLMRPPLNPRTYLLWGGPLVILVLGAGGLYIRSRQNIAIKKTAKLSPKEEAELEALLKEKSDKGGDI